MFYMHASMRRLMAWPLYVGPALVSAALSFGAVLLPPLAPPALAQAAGMFGLRDADTVTAKATVKSIDLKTRMVTLVGPKGETMTMKAGDQVQNLAQVKPGDVVVVSYHDSVAYVVAPPGTKLPEDAMTVAEARAKPGELPAGGIGAKAVVTGLVVGVNPGAHTISLVNPDGGQIRTLDVKDPQYQQMLGNINVGDTITAVVSEALIAAVEPAK